MTPLTRLIAPKFSRAWPFYLLLLCLPPVLLTIFYGLSVSYDGPIHLLRIARLHDAIQQGIIFPRWMSNQLLGYGYPALNYYASASYYLVEAFQLSGLPLYWAYVSAQSLFIFLAAMGSYLFARDLMGKEQFWPPLVAAIAYSYAPYFLVNIYVRGAIAEQAAQMLLPWILWSFRRIWRAPVPKHYVVTAAFLLAALAFTHTISLLLIPPFLVGYLVILAWDIKPRGERVRWTLLALGGAMAISSFFWLPLIVERDYVSTMGYTISLHTFLPNNFLEVDKILYTSLRYIYSKDIDYYLSILQIIGVMIGLPFVIRRWREGHGKEWLYFIGVMLLLGVMMTKVTLPLWLSHELFAIIQFPFRLLGIIQIPVALLTALPFVYIKNRYLRATSAILTIALLIWAFWPRLPWMQTISHDTSYFNMPMNAFFEVEVKQIVEGGAIATSLQEFRPRWVSPTLELNPDTVEATPRPNSIKPLAANPLHQRIQTSASSPFLLRLNTFFFPGWQITLEDGTKLAPHPSTSLGLLTAEIPAGEHVVDVKWVGTSIAFWAAVISQLALLFFIVWQATQPGRRLWALALTPLLLIALFASYWSPPLTPITRTPSDSRIPGVKLVGYGKPTVSKDGITVRPFWFVQETSPPELTTRWSLYNQDGENVAQVDATPFYDFYSTKAWPANTLVDDAQFIPLPDALPAGSYQVVLQPLKAEDDTPLFTLQMGNVTIKSPTPEITPPRPLDIYLGENIALKGYDLRVVERLWEDNPFLQQSPEVAILHPNENLVYELYWELINQTDKPYSGFVHLTDRLGNPLVQVDQSPGPIFAPVSIWGTGRLYKDDYMLNIPDDTPSGLYWPQVGMYNWENQSRFDVRDTNGEMIGDHYLLPPIKVINRAVEPVGTSVGTKLGDMAELVRYTLSSDEGEVTTNPLMVGAGSTLTLTTYYRVEQPSATAYTRFIQLRDDANQIVVQMDSEPQDGQNPTWAWVAGEIVQDTTILSIPADAPLGEYQIYIGFYEPTGDYPRLPLTDQAGERLANDELPLPLDAAPLIIQIVN